MSIQFQPGCFDGEPWRDKVLRHAEVQKLRRPLSSKGPQAKGFKKVIEWGPTWTNQLLLERDDF